jgi:hypothetical protein
VRAEVRAIVGSPSPAIVLIHLLLRDLSRRSDLHTDTLDSYGIFRLTNPPGLEHILSCTHSDTFHQHQIDNLYREAEQPHGHVYESDKLPYTVQDLRTK